MQSAPWQRELKRVTNQCLRELEQTWAPSGTDAWELGRLNAEHFRVLSDEISLPLVAFALTPKSDGSVCTYTE